jgi:kumamolisin
MAGDVDVTLWLAPPFDAGFTAEAVSALGAKPVAQRDYISRAELRTRGDTPDIVRAAVAVRLRESGVSLVEHAWRRIRIRGSFSACTEAISDLLSSPCASDIVYFFGMSPTTAARSYARTSTAPQRDSLLALDVARAYRMPSGLKGNGVAVGILHLAGRFDPDDFALAMAAAKVTPPRCVLRGAPEKPTPEDDVEVALDTQIIGAIAPESTLVLYNGTQDPCGYAEAVADVLLDDHNAPSILSISYGVLEQEWPPEALVLLDQLLIAAALCGITVVVASGDGGADVLQEEPRVNFPASSRFVLACGGTNLRLGNGRRVSETVWNEVARASGGGYSATFPRSAWQPGTGISQNRGLPDVAGHAATAAGYRIYVGGKPQPVGGTSAVAPLWAAFFALLNQRLGRPCGFVAPLLYAAPKQLFYDITTGSNGGYVAGRGWDACTGLGSPHFGEILRYLVT